MPGETRKRAHEPPLADEIATELDALGDGAPPASDTRVFLFLRREGALELRSLGEGDAMLLGRSAEADVVVDDTRVSRLHARLQNRDGAIVVEDLGSRNGTRLDGELLPAAQVARRGAVIVVGPLEIVVAGPQPKPEDGAAPRAPRGDQPASEVVAVDPAMIALFEMVKRLAPMPTNVLIVGETGTGKEVVAEQLHAQGPRAKRAFVTVNCAALPEALLESELFGHEKGAFTGAAQRKVGHIEAATGGTLLLDEIGDMPLAMQPKLLRVLENKRLVRVGGREEVEVDVRIVSATHRDLAKEVAAGRFREDLFYRLAGFTLRVPPLRERKTEIVPLARRFAARFAARAGLEVPAIERSAAARLLLHDWPGNARELRNAIEHAMILCAGPSLRAEHLPDAVRSAPPAASEAGLANEAGPIRDRVADVERNSILEALEKSGGNRQRAAERLGISRRALLYKLAKYRIK